MNTPEHPTPSPDKLAAQAETPTVTRFLNHVADAAMRHLNRKTNLKGFCDEVNASVAPVADMERALTQLRAENERLHESLDFHGRGDVPKGWDAAIARAEAAEEQLTHLKAELERANGIIANLSREKNETKNDIPDDEIVRREFDKLRLEQERNRIRYPAH